MDTPVYVYVVQQTDLLQLPSRNAVIESGYL
jgi:hypothetical protein